ncbi:MAG: hypothetical protein IK130_05400 [Oscillospiraceae bacterium]|nr:hypothetical protein [Oscillospiraceae bacterium]
MAQYTIKKPQWLPKISIGYLGLSIFLAFVAWGLIAMKINPEYQQVFQDVPVTVDITGTKAQDYELSVISKQMEDPKVNITLHGTRSALGGLTAKDVSAYVDFDSLVNVVGKQKLPIKVKCDAAYVSIETSMQDFEVEMDRFGTRDINVTEIRHDNIKPADTETIVDEEKISCDPLTVKIKAPTSALEKLDHIRLIIDDDETITETQVFSNITHYELIDKDGAKLSEDAYQVQATRYSVKVPVYYERAVPVTVNVLEKGVPKNFDFEWIKSRLRIISGTEYHLPGFTSEGEEPLSITIRTENLTHKQNLDNLEAFSVGDVPLTALTTKSKAFPLEISLDEGLTNASNLNSVEIALDTTDLYSVTRTIDNSTIQPVNGAADLKYTIAPGRTQVTLVGLKDEVLKITDNDVRAAVVLYNRAVNDAGSFAEALTISLPDEFKHVWVSPLPKVSVTATVKETTAAPQEESYPSSPTY